MGQASTEEAYKVMLGPDSYREQFEVDELEEEPEVNDLGGGLPTLGKTTCWKGFMAVTVTKWNVDQDDMWVEEARDIAALQAVRCFRGGR